MKSCENIKKKSLIGSHENMATWEWNCYQSCGLKFRN